MQAPALAKRITWSLYTEGAETDEQIRTLLRERTDSVYHPVGTCRMGNDPLAVVDAQLRVHGLQALRIVDASIMPTLIGGNTNAPTILIAEKAVDLICGLPQTHSCARFENAVAAKNNKEVPHVTA
nr:GMC oxidoreductase [Pseudomonas californiensis]